MKPVHSETLELSTSPIYIILFLSVALVCASSLVKNRRSDGRPYPPGPAPLPFIGNALDMPRSQEWLRASEWEKKYGRPITVYLRRIHILIFK